MLAASIIVFRETLEAALVAGIVLAATRGVAGSRAWVAGGIVAGLAGAVVVAASADAISNALAGMGQEMFNAGILLVAVAMLGWHTVWMSRHGREIAAEMKQVGHTVSVGSRPLSVLGVVVGIAVLREGAETVLFLYGIAASGGGNLADTLAGAALGMAAGALVGGLLYGGLLAVPTRHLFAVTGGLVTLLAAGMAAQAVNFLGQAGMLNVGGEPVWDSSHLLSEDSLTGRLLHTLIGYVDRPSAAQIAAYGATVLAITLLSRLASPQRQRC